MIWELIAFNTDSHHPEIKYREYTNDEKRARAFVEIPMIHTPGTGHGIVFIARKHEGKREPVIRELRSYVRNQIKLIKKEWRKNEK